MRRRAFEAIPHGGHAYYGPGDEPASWTPGDFILTRDDAWTSKVIRFGQGLRIHGQDRKYTHWNHAALLVTSGGEIIEALGAGVRRQHVSKYRPGEYVLVRTHTSPLDRAETVNFARWAAGEVDATGAEVPPRQRRPQAYGFTTILSIAYSLLTGGKFTFALDGQEICSGLVARSLERTGAIFNRDPVHIMPADLAKYFSVEIPSAPAVEPATELAGAEPDAA